MGVTCEQFLINQVPEVAKKNLIAIHFYDKALLWHRQFVKNIGSVSKIWLSRGGSNAREYEDVF